MVKKYIVAFFYELVSYAVAIFVLCSLVFVFLGRSVLVDGVSMNDTLQDKDRLIMESFLFEPTYEDIVIVNRFTNAGKAQSPLIKRVIGLPGDVLEIKQTEVYRNGVKLDEPYIHYPNDCEMTVTVPENEVFVMGDHRNKSSDSRAFGPFKKEEIVGVVHKHLDIQNSWPFAKIYSIE